MTSGDREWLRVTFESAAALYQQARPEYPAELYDELRLAASVGPEGRLLEVGCATGKATLPLARRGLRITCLELGASGCWTRSPGTSRCPTGSGGGSTRRSTAA